MMTKSSVISGAVFAALLATVAVGGEGAKAPSADEIIKQLTGGAEAPKRSPKELEAAYRTAIDALAAKLARDDVGSQADGDRKLEALCARASTPGIEASRLAAVRALLTKLGADLPTHARRRVIRHIERIGAAEAVPALAALLADKGVREPARRALVRNPTPAAVEALRGALPKADKPFRIALIDALGARADRGSLKLLIAQAQDADEDVRGHAAQALARIADPSAAPVLAAAMKRGSERCRRSATDSCLALADSLAAKSDEKAALGIYRALLGPKSHVKCAALVGIGKTGSARDVGTLVAALGGSDQERGAATEALALLPGKDTTAAVAAKAKAAEPKLKTILLHVLGKRGDPSVLPLLVGAAKDNDEAVRIAALQAMGDLKATGAAPTLVAALKAAKGAERDKAEWALSRIPGEQTTQAIAAAIKSADKDGRSVLLRSLGYRKDPNTLPALIASTKDPEEAVRAAAFRAMGQLGHIKGLDTILAALETVKGAERDAAVYALRGMQGREATAAMIEAAKKSAAPSVLAPILTVLSWRDDPAVGPFLLAGARNPAPAVQAAALDGLARLKDPGAAPLIIAAATKSQGAVRDAAVRTSLQYVDELIKADKAAAAQILTLALNRKIVKRWADRKLALRGLAQVGGLDVIDKIRRDFSNYRVASDAFSVAFRIAERLAQEGKKAEAVEAYTKIMHYSSFYPHSIRRCQSALRKLGVKGDLVQRAGFITRWFVLGPFPSPANALFEKQLPPEKGVDLAKPVTAEGRTCQWKPCHTTNPTGIVDLESVVAKDNYAAAYLYAEITVPKAIDVYLKVGYDDGIVAYVNGKRVANSPGGRGLRVDSQRCNARLEAGANKILLKVLNTGPRWAVCARLTDRKNVPIEFTQREK
jgi:HEAT repeat protein